MDEAATTSRASREWPVRRRWQARPRRRAVVASALVVPLLLGLAVLVWQARHALDGQAEAIHAFVGGRIDAMLGHASDAAGDVADLVGSPCLFAAPRLRLAVASRPFTRSLNLTENGRIYCASLEGAVDLPEDADDFADGRLRLMPGSRVTPERVVIAYRKATPAGAVVVGIDGQHVLDVLSVGANEFAVRLGVGGRWVDADGTLATRFEAPGDPVVTLVRSAAFPFTVGVAYDRASVWRSVARDFWPSWLLLALLAGGFAYAVHRFASRRNAPTAELRRALEADEFVPFYQPVVVGSTGALAGAEVLIRWMHPVEGIIPPDQFIPLAERTGLIVEMTYRLMDRVRQELVEHESSLPARIRIAFNICAAHCTNMELLDRCRAFLGHFPAGNVVLFLELTEREAIPATKLTDELFMRLDRLGVQVALDDFGTGNSSLDYLQRFTVNALKIDRSFIVKAGPESPSRHILDIIAELAARLKLDLVAEGVETEAQRDYLDKLGVGYMQGYLFGRPAPFRAFAAAHLRRPG